jgi:hypothetical protein
MDTMDTNEMRLFCLAHARLVAKAKELGMQLNAEEIARRMLIVQEARVYDPDEYERDVLVEPFRYWAPNNFR